MTLLGISALGWLCAVLIGLSLGLLGGGGSVLTVPTFVYVIGLAPKPAIATSLPVVGIAAAAGAVLHWRRGTVHPRALALFAPAAMAGAYLGARLSEAMPGSLQAMILAIVMLAAAVAMLRPRADDGPAAHEPHPVLLLGVGAVVGMLTGVVGVGGGFLLVPALVVLGGLATKPAIGTSLAIIALNSGSGTVGYRGSGLILWNLVAIFGAIAVAGTLVGSALVKHVPAAQLRRGFAILLLAIGVLMLAKPR